MEIAARIREIEERIAKACSSAGRPRDAVRLVGVCKRQYFERIAAAYDAGLRDFGESTAQGLRNTATALHESGRREARWHFVGALQRNKVNQVLGCRPLVHSLDRPSLAEALSKRAGNNGVDVLLQVNVGEETQKAGVAPGEALELARDLAGFPGLRLRGLMAMSPKAHAPEPFFEALARLSAEICQTAEWPQANELSMGMSGDFEQAIAAGATIVRVGTGLFGPRAS